MKERVSCFDIDGTLSKGLLFVPLVKSEHANEYISDRVFEYINELLLAYKSGDLEYENAVDELLQVHAKGLEGKKYQDLKMHAKNFLKLHEKELLHNFGREVAQMLGAHHKLLVVTAEAQYLAEVVADIYNIHGCVSSLYEVTDGRFTGNVERSLAYRAAKATSLQGYDIEYAFGDSEGDIDMLDNARFPHAINPTAGLQSIAEERAWQIFDGSETEAIVTNVSRTLS